MQTTKEIPREALRLQLEALGIPAERHTLQPFDDDPDVVAEVLIYLVGKKLIEIPSPLEASLQLQWGAQLCRFYRSQEELLELVVAFFKQGLKDHERCIWVVSPPLTLENAHEALVKAMPELERYSDQLSFHDYDDWSVEAWMKAERRALDQGYLGLRLSGDGVRLGQLRHDFQKPVRTKLLCTYAAAGCKAARSAERALASFTS